VVSFTPLNAENAVMQIEGKGRVGAPETLIAVAARSQKEV